MEFKFGERVLVKASLKRQRGKPDKDGNITLNTDYRYWLREEYDKPQEAIFLGKRVLQNGSYGYGNLGGGYEQEPEYAWNPEPETYIPGAWICREGRNPEKVFLIDIEQIPVRKSIQDLLEIIGQEILETYGLEVEEN